MSERTLYYGDNLDILRNHLADESVDLIYLDPPFNSQADYNILFREETGELSPAQIRAFTDYWHWDTAAEATYVEIIEACPAKVSKATEALRELVGSNPMMAYLVMMTLRLVELRRVLKPTGSLYLHCDPTASHYLKIILDTVFGPRCFLNEIVWKRTFAHSSSHRYGPVHDLLLLYGKTSSHKWNPVYTPYDDEYLETFFDQTDPDGRRWMRMDLTAAGTRRGETGKVWRGIDVTAKGRHWAYPPDELEKLDAAARIHWPAKAGGMPRLKRYAEDTLGVVVQDVWTDIRPLHNLSSERLGYDTQKPSALLERIIACSSDKGDLVLDPFCGCGTAVAAAEKLGRQWIGIDITHLAINVMKKRLRDSFPGIQKKYEVIGEPKDVPSARALAKQGPGDAGRWQFQWWALGLDAVDSMPLTDDRKKGADQGVDGMRSFVDGPRGKTIRVNVQVKSGKVSAKDIRDLKGTMGDETLGLFITLEEPSQEMKTEAAKTGFYKSETWKRNFPRLQILTIEQLLAGTKPDLPGPTAITKKAPRVLKHKQPRLKPPED